MLNKLDWTEKRSLKLKIAPGAHGSPIEPNKIALRVVDKSLGKSGLIIHLYWIICHFTEKKCRYKNIKY